MKLPPIRCEPIVYAVALNVAVSGALLFAFHWPADLVAGVGVVMQAVEAPFVRSRVVPTAKLGQEAVTRRLE